MIDPCRLRAKEPRGQLEINPNLALTELGMKGKTRVNGKSGEMGLAGLCSQTRMHSPFLGYLQLAGREV